MKSFHKTHKLSLLVLGLGMIASAHAAIVTIELDDDNCGMTYGNTGDTFLLIGDMECGKVADGKNFALTFTGDDNKIFLQGHSITAQSSDEPDRGIRIIEGSGNQVIGPGTVKGFVEQAIRISNGSNNRVSGLHLSDSDFGVVIIGRDNFFSDEANGNFIVDNTIDTVSGIRLRSDNGSTQANLIFHNSMQVTSRGIAVSSISGGSVEDNIISTNRIEEPGAEGIRLRASGAGTTMNNNEVSSNIIIRPADNSIKLVAAGGGPTMADNAILSNVTKDPQSDPDPVYCDDSGDLSNLWPINFIGLQPEFGNPGTC